LRPEPHQHGSLSCGGFSGARTRPVLLFIQVRISRPVQFEPEPRSISPFTFRTRSVIVAGVITSEKDEKWSGLES